MARREITASVSTWNVCASSSAPENPALDAWLHVADKPDIIAVLLVEVVDINNPLSYLAGVPNVVGSIFDTQPRLDGLSEPVTAEAAAWEVSLAKHLPNHVLMARKQQVGNLALVFVAMPLVASCSNARVAAIGTGPLGAGNKGAVGISLGVHGSTLCLLCAHLAAGTKGPAARNKDVATIVSKLAFPANPQPASGAPTAAPKPPLSIEAHDFVVWGGDLNYRISLKDEAVHAFVKSTDLAALAAADELKTAQAAGQAFAGYDEGALDFLPTYKYDANSDVYDTSAKRRAPAWTDRILWREGEHVSSTFYGRHEMRDSDHRPVSAVLRLSVLAGDRGVDASALPQPGPCGQLAKCVKGCFGGKPEADDYQRLT